MDQTEIQAYIDRQIAKHNLTDYVEYVRYLPGDSLPPPDATHVISVRANQPAGPKVEVAVKARMPYNIALTAVLAVI